MSRTTMFLFIPDVALEKIFSFLSFDEIARNRVVCRKFNEVGGRMLSRGFIQLERRHALIFKKVKSLLPRRESERRVHPLSRHCDILQAVETRISMLNMTYMKYIENNLLCFIPGKVLDEMINVLNLVESDCTPPRTHQLLQELRDLSSMAMEHFDEHVLPRVKEHREQLDEKRQVLLGTCSTNSSNFKQSKPFLQQVNDLQKIKKQYKVYKHHILYLSEKTRKLMQKMKKQNTRIKAQSIKIRDQERKIQDQYLKIQEQETALADIKKHLDDWDQKYKDLTTELVRVRDDNILLNARSSPPKASTSTIGLPLPPKIFKSNIGPKMAHILPKNCATYNLGLDRKRKANLVSDIPVKLTRNDVFDDTDEHKNHTIARDLNNPKEKMEDKRAISLLIENLIKSPTTSQKSRKRKMEETTLK